MITKLKGKLDYGNTTINYSVIKTKRRKTSEITVDKDIVEIRTPYDKPDQEIRNIVKDKASMSDVIRTTEFNIGDRNIMSEKKLSGPEKKMIVDAIKENNFFGTHINDNISKGEIYYLSIALDKNRNGVMWHDSTPETNKLDNLRKTVLSIAGWVGNPLQPVYQYG